MTQGASERLSRERTVRGREIVMKEEGGEGERACLTLESCAGVTARLRWSKKS
jgi:hypothetical protein